MKGACLRAGLGCTHRSSHSLAGRANSCCAWNTLLAGLTADVHPPCSGSPRSPSPRAFSQPCSSNPPGGRPYPSTRSPGNLMCLALTTTRSASLPRYSLHSLCSLYTIANIFHSIFTFLHPFLMLSGRSLHKVHVPRGRRLGQEARSSRRSSPDAVSLRHAGYTLQADRTNKKTNQRQVFYFTFYLFFSFSCFLFRLTSKITFFHLLHFSIKGLYNCPCYYYPQRCGDQGRPAYVVTVDLNAGAENAAFWTKRGTALLLSLAT